MEISDKLRAFRERYRAERIPANYSGVRHLGFTLIFSLGVVIIALWNLDAVRWWEWLTLPVTFLYANLVEYWMHRTVMHRPVRPLREIYQRHARHHHVFFTHEHMALESSRDLHVVLFPPMLLVFFIGGFAVPAGMLLAWLTTPNIAWLFVALAAAYLANYEIFHTAYHVPEGHWMERLPLIRRLRGQHWRHHRPELMAHRNFNVTYPIGDWLFGTRA